MISITGGQLIALLALLIPISAIVMNGLTKMKEQRGGGLSDDAERALLEKADRLHERVTQLEKILDAEAPGWRSRAS